MILTHGANSLQRGVEMPFYLSYFDRLNLTTGDDIPVIGSSSLILKSGTAKKTIRKYKNSYISFLTGPDNLLVYGINSILSSQVISIEWLDYFFDFFNRDNGIYAGIAVVANSKDIQISSSASNGIGVTIDYPNNTPYQNWYYDRIWSDSGSYTGSYALYYGPNMQPKKCYHYAVVYDFTEKKMYGYVEGDLVIVNDFSSFDIGELGDIQLKPHFNKTYGNWNSLNSQYAAFDFDKSYNNRMNYGVPTDLYHIPEQPLTETIGGKKYRVVQMPDGKTWMADNLDMTWEGLIIGSSTTSSSTPMANYPNNNSNVYNVDSIEPYGLLYNWSAAKYLNDNRGSLIPGWHVPSYQELLDLSDSLGGNSVAGGKLKDMACYGSNEYNFNLLMPGYFNNGFIDVNNSVSIWSTDAYDNDMANYIYCMLNDSRVNPGHYYKYVGFSIRLVKDAT